jgi:polyhydroxybutyrate depolymerase
MKYLLFLISIVPYNFYSQSQKVGWIKNIQINHGGITRYFDLFIPKNLKTNPELVIQLHGGTQSKDDLHKQNAGASKYWKEVSEENSFLLILPNGIDTKTGNTKSGKLNWNDCRIHLKEIQADDVGFISKIIDWSVLNYQVNDKKVFVTGVSNGGLMCYRLALEIPQKITAIAAFNANLYKESECKNTNIPIPVMIVNGTEDEFMPFYGGKTKFRNEEALSSQETVNFWIKNNYIRDKEYDTHKHSSIKNDNGQMKSITYNTYYDNECHVSIHYYEIKNAGHAMPGRKYVLSRLKQRILGKQNQDIEGAQIAWNFFKSVCK